MSFEKAEKFLLCAAQKYNIKPQAVAALVCKRAKNIFFDHFSEFVEFWDPIKFENQKLTIATNNSAAASELFLRTNEILDLLKNIDLPEQVLEICIRRNIKK